MASPVADGYSAASGVVLACGRTNVAATSVYVNDFADQKVFQRVGTSKDVVITGGFVGSPTLLQWRVVDHTNSSIARSPWATLAVNPTGTTFSKSVNIPQGGWYKIQVRCGTNTAITGTTSNKMGVGIFILEFGQSNMVNRKDTGIKRPLGDRRAVHWSTSNTYDRIGNINDSTAPNTESDGAGYSTPSVTIQGTTNGDGYVYLANLVSQAINVPVCIVNRAVSGSAIASWIAGGTNNWSALVTALTAAGGDCEFALWHQGEADANLMSIATMKSNLATVHNQLKALTGRTNSTLHFGIVGLGIGSFSGSSEGEFGNMRAAHSQFAAETAGVYYSTSAHDTYTGDGVHINGAGFNIIGRRDAKSALHRLGIGTSGSGPRVLTATRSGAVITLNVTHSGGNALTDGGGGSGTALTGFEVFDNGVAATITATSIASSTTIQLTLSATPSGPVTVQYAMMNNPHSANATTAPTLASIVYDNATYHISTLGCPLQPFAAITATT